MAALEAEATVRAAKEKQIEEKKFTREKVFTTAVVVEANTTIQPSAVVEGPVVVGASTFVETLRETLAVLDLPAAVKTPSVTHVDHEAGDSPARSSGEAVAMVASAVKVVLLVETVDLADTKLNNENTGVVTVAAQTVALRPDHTTDDITGPITHDKFASFHLAETLVSMAPTAADAQTALVADTPTIAVPIEVE